MNSALRTNNRFIISAMFISLAFMMAFFDRYFYSNVFHRDTGLLCELIIYDTSPTINNKQELNIEQSIPLQVKPGDNLYSILRRAKIVESQISSVIKALQKAKFDLRRLRLKSQIFITTSQQESGNGYNLLSMIIRPSLKEEILLKQKEDSSFSFEKRALILQEQSNIVSGTITQGLYLDAVKSGAEEVAVIKMIRELSHSVDFGRCIQKGDHFTLMYSNNEDPTTGQSSFKRVNYVRLKMRSQIEEIFYYKNGHIEGYYNAAGETARKTLLRTPLLGPSYISSGYGKRRHPILGYTKMHQGIDFAAPKGTKVISAGDGIISSAFYYSSYGNYVLVNHRNGYKTAYAHLSRFAKGIRPGMRIKQGQVIGFVGATGRASGAHLHYEVHSKGKKINPAKIKYIPKSNRKLTGQELQTFLTHVEAVKKECSAGLNKRNGGNKINKNNRHKNSANITMNKSPAIKPIQLNRKISKVNHK